MDQKYLTDSESLSLNIEATCLLLSSPRNFPYEIKMDKYRPYPSMISMFTSNSQHPPRSRHAVHLGEDSPLYILRDNSLETQYCFSIPKICFSLKSSADHDEILQQHLCWVFTAFHFFHCIFEGISCQEKIHLFWKIMLYMDREARESDFVA